MKSTKVLGPTQAGGTPYGPVNRVSGAASVKLPVLAKLTIGSITGAGQYLCHEFETNQQALRERAQARARMLRFWSIAPYRWHSGAAQETLERASDVV